MAASILGFPLVVAGMAILFSAIGLFDMWIGIGASIILNGLVIYILLRYIRDKKARMEKNRQRRKS